MTPNREPVIWAFAVRWVIFCTMVFGLTLTAMQLVAVMGVVEAVLVLVVRAKVTANVNVPPVAMTERPTPPPSSPGSG